MMPHVPASSIRNTQVAPPLSSTVYNVCCKGIFSMSLGTMSVGVCDLIESKLNQSAHEFISDSMDYNQFIEYSGHNRSLAVYIAQSAALSLAFFSATGGLTGLLNIGKSLYDRVCNHLAS
ncbi:hypothetical protein [Endozoicomonas acroporae]|uniref:hypothetical protein n=1 Tax=Endozoicomonas acroporae TaxID=1701104 RepID=UPI003D7A3C43